MAPYREKSRARSVPSFAQSGPRSPTGRFLLPTFSSSTRPYHYISLLFAPPPLGPFSSPPFPDIPAIIPPLPQLSPSSPSLSALNAADPPNPYATGQPSYPHRPSQIGGPFTDGPQGARVPIG
ncbi:hypothetical protein ALC53_12553 [Atta colombica]|uniref:Uncharacterized protein n=1 Tax=Atta colombica TaxID=520822 RepID=A0A195AYA0_9HYME|nr:hypothetical protein ALC53_12553 [Atta colombica]